MPDLPDLLSAIRDRPDDEAAWLALASWLWDHGRDDEAAIVRVYWPTLRDNVTVCGVSLHETLRNVARLARRAREVEAQREQPPVE